MPNKAKLMPILSTIVAIFSIFSFITMVDVIATEKEGTITGQAKDQEKTFIDSNLENTTKELLVQGKTLKAEYSETKRKSGYNKHDTLIYTNENGDKLGYDAKTGQLIYLDIKGLISDPELDPSLQISQKEAKAIAEDFLTANCDMARYSFIDCEHDKHTNDFIVRYVFLYQGYQTTEDMSLSITNSGEIRFFTYKPYVFDDVGEKPIDKSSILIKLDNLITSNPQNISYEIKSFRLHANENKDLFMEFIVLVEFSQQYEDGEKDVLTTEIGLEIQVPAFIVSYEYKSNDIYVNFDYGDKKTRSLLGDINNDGQVKATDARTALRASAKLEVLNAEASVLADVNKDGKVTAVDARTILRVSANLQYFGENPIQDPGFIPTPKNPEVLSEEQEEQIKNDWIATWDNKHTETPEVNLEYFGTYNKGVALMIYDNYISYTQAEWREVVSEVTFHYGDGRRILIWSEGNFYDLHTAYEKNLLTKDNLRNISYYHHKYHLDVSLKLGETYSMATLDGDGLHNWYCSVSPKDGVDVTFISETISLDTPNPSEIPVRTTFSFLAKKPGVYTVNLKLASSLEGDAIDDFSFTITVIE